MKRINKTFFVFILLLVIQNKAFTQSEVITLSDTSSNFIDIGKQVYVYEDKTGQLQLQDILLKDQQFERSKQQVPNYGVTKSNIWIRMDIRNNSNEEWMLVIGFPNIDTVSFYYPENGIYKLKNTGLGFTMDQRDFRAVDFIFQIPQ